MKEEETKQATRLINAWAEGDDRAAHDLFRLFENELSILARSALATDPQGREELEPAGLISELFLRLDKYFKGAGQARTAGQGDDGDDHGDGDGNAGARAFPNRKYFYAMALKVMRNILIDMAKKGGAAKPRQSRFVSVSAAGAAAATRVSFDPIDFYDTLDRLRARNPEQAEALERHYILGQTLSEVAAEMSASTATVKRRLVAAKQWFEIQLRRD